MGVQTLANVRPFQDKTVEDMRGRYFGRYMGYVRDRADPKQLGRVRCYVPAIISDDTPKGWLDWCMPSSTAFAVPPPGEPVWIEFEQGQVQYGIYTWGWVKGDDAQSSTAPNAAKGLEDPTWVTAVSGSTGGFGGDMTISIPEDTAYTTRPEYPYNKVFQSENGHRLELDDTPGRLRARYYHPTGTTVFIDSDGSVHIRSAGATHHHSEGDYNILLGEGATFKVVYPNGGGIAVGASGVTINGFQTRILGRPVLISTEPI